MATAAKVHRATRVKAANIEKLKPLCSGGGVFHYKAYGLAVLSDRPLPELPTSSDSGVGSRTRVSVRLKARRSHSCEPCNWLNVGMDDAGKPWFKCARIDGGYLLRYTGLADFLIAADGSEISCIGSAANVSELTLRHLLLDQAFPRLLNLLGREALHATAIATSTGVCAFLGAAGTGKSTLAASFQAQGYHSVCDDCLVLDEVAGQIFATPGYPGVRLWQDSLAAIAGPRPPTMPVSDYTSKSRLLGAKTQERFTSEPHPLKRIYWMTRGGPVDAPLVERISPAEIFPQLISSSFPLDISDRQMLTRHFRLFSRVAAEVPARRLHIPNDFAALAAVRRAIFADLEVE